MIKWLSLFLLCCIISCKEENKSTGAAATTDSVKKESLLPPPSGESYDRMAGTYAGDFDGSDIRVVLRHLTGRNAVGYNLHRGLRRNISGTMRGEEGGFAFELSEPGDHPFDGVFRFTIDPDSRTLKGTWAPQKQSSGLTQKTLNLRYTGTDSAKRGYEVAAMFSDSIGSFNFNPDGLVIYTYYPKEKGALKQLQTINGNWKLSGRTISIDWAQNTVFPSRKTTFAIKGDGDLFDEPYELTLEGAGRMLYADGI